MHGQVLVLGGGGSTALHGVAVARALGSLRVLYLDPDEARRDLALALGAEADAGPVRPELGEFDVVFDASGNADLVMSSMRNLAPHGAIESAGLPFGDVPMPGKRSYFMGVRFHTGLGNAGFHIRTALDLIQSGHIDPTALLTETLPMDEADTALVEPSMKPLFVR